jgi:hypothetical protein
MYLMIESGCKLPELDGLFLWVSRNPNLHGELLRSQIESGELDFDPD